MVARLLTPMMAAHFMKPSQHNDNADNTGKMMQRYIKMVGWCIEHRKKTLLITGGFFIASLMLLVFIPNTFFPAEEGNQIQFSVQVPPGSKIDVISSVLKQSTQQTKDLKSISSVYATIGNGVKSGEDIAIDNNVTKGTLIFNLIEDKLRPHHQTKAQLEKLIQARLKKIPGARFSGEGGNGERYSMSITGDDKTLLNETAKKLEGELRGLKNIGNISSDFDLSRPEVKIRPDFNKAAKFGVTSNSIGEVIRVATAGDYSNNLAKIDLPDRQIPIMVTPIQA
jgi:multidrug efflux pump subunit AcrB